jgi:CBS domain-containing membrane protein
MPVKHIKRSYRKVKFVMYKETLIDKTEHFFTFLGAFFGIGIIGFINSKYFVLNDNIFINRFFWRYFCFNFWRYNSPLAQPRNLIFGHLISAFIGVLIHKLIPNNMWLSSALAVSLSIVVMQITKTMHPPGGATALIANIGSEKIKALGFYYILSPVFQAY